MTPWPRDSRLPDRRSSKRWSIRPSTHTLFSAHTNSGVRHKKTRTPQCRMQGAGQRYRAMRALLFGLLDVRCLLALRAIDNFELHLFPFAEGLEAVALDRREVDKNVFATLASNKPIALAIVKPLDRTSWHATFSVPVHKAEHIESKWQGTTAPTSNCRKRGGEA